MLPILRALLSFVASRFRSGRSLELEVLALRHQLGVYERGGKRPRLRPADRLWPGLCLRRKRGRPGVPVEIRALIRRVSMANPLWGAPRNVGELGRIGIDMAKSTVEKCMRRPGRPGASKQTWKAFLRNHGRGIVSVDFFVVPTIRNQVLFVFLVLELERRRVVHFNVTAHPNQEARGRTPMGIA